MEHSIRVTVNGQERWFSPEKAKQSWSASSLVEVGLNDRCLRETLYVLRNGLWVLVRSEWADDVDLGESTSIITQEDAVLWLLDNNQEVPAELADLARSYDLAEADPADIPPTSADTSRKTIDQFAAELNAVVESVLPLWEVDPTIILKPRWEQGTGKLWWGDRLLLQRSNKQAPCRELLLTAFEDHGWLERIDDPLNKNQLKDTLRHLNASLGDASPITFTSDGSGKGIIWQVRPSSAPDVRHIRS